MSEPGSVRTGSRPAEGAVRTDGGAPAAPGSSDAPPDAPPPVATQAVPVTGGVRAQSPATGATPAGAPPRTPASGAMPAQAAAGRGAVSGPVSGTAAATRPAAGGAAASAARRGRPGRGPRRAKLQLRHIDTWSAFKISFVLSVALFCIWMVAVGILYGVLQGLGVINTLNDLFGQLGSASGGKSSGNVITPGIVFWGAAIIGAVNVVLLTALGTVATFIYNLSSDLVGGLEVTLSERD